MVDIAAIPRTARGGGRCSLAAKSGKENDEASREFRKASWSFDVASGLECSGLQKTRICAIITGRAVLPFLTRREPAGRQAATLDLVLE
jgi:hypothetical protein